MNRTIIIIPSFFSIFSLRNKKYKNNIVAKKSTGRSNLSIVLSTTNPDITAPKPVASNKSQTLLPIKSPIDRLTTPFLSEVIATDNSGNPVPNPSKNIPIKV